MWDYSKIGLLIGIVTAVNALTLFMMRQLLESHRRSFAKQVESLTTVNTGQDDDISEVKEELSDFRVEVAKNYIHREDAIIYFGRFEQKIDAIWGYLINGKRGPHGS